MSKQLFDEVIGEVPAPAVDVATIIRHERRRRAARATWITTAVVALSTTAAIGLSTAAGSGTPAHRAVAAPSATSPLTAVSPDDQFSLAANTTRSAAEIAGRLSGVLDKSVHTEAPSAEWIYTKKNYVDGQAGRHNGEPPLVHSVIRSGTDATKYRAYVSDVGIRNGGRIGYFRLLVVPHPTDKNPANNLLDCKQNKTCVEGTTKDGRKTASWYTYGPPERGTDGAYEEQNIAVGLPDGRILTLDVGDEFTVHHGVAEPHTLPLTRDKLMAIGIDVASYIKP